MMTRLIGTSLFVAALCVACTADAPPRRAGPSDAASPSPSASSSRSQDPLPATAAALRRAVDVDGMTTHLRALDRIAARNGGTRSAGTPGDEASVDYVVEALRRAGYKPELDRFEAPVFTERRPSTLHASGVRTFRGRDVKAALYSPGGNVTGDLVTIAYDAATEEEAPGPGCDPDAFSGVPDGAVVLIQPGPCFLRDQVVNAESAGAAAVVFAYPSFDPGSVLRPTLITPEAIDVPVLLISDRAGDALVRAGADVRVTVTTSTRTREATLRNVIAERSGRSREVVMIGGHLDSALDGPGINDNGSGVAAILEIARAVARMRPDRTVRFAFWGGEEYGLLGSTHYVRALASEERDRLGAYINLDMIASPNFGRFVYDATGPDGSAEIERLFFDFFRGARLAAVDIDLEGASDHAAFESAGVAVGGVFSGANEHKVPTLAERFGGRAGRPYDPCYHEPCDDLSNLNRKALDQLADAAAHVVARLANR